MKPGRGIPSLTCALGACVELYNINEGRVYWILFPRLLKVAPGHRQLVINRRVSLRRSRSKAQKEPET